jgi:hypothetical protein
MAYDRYENRGGWRDDDRRDRDYRGERDDRGGGDDRGFFERARDEVQSWFGDEEAERRRMADDRMSHPDSDRYSPDREGRGAFFGGGDRHDRDHERDSFRGSRERGEQHGGGDFFRGGRERYDPDEDRGRSYGGGQASSYGRGREGGDYRNQHGRGGGESGGFGGGRYQQPPQQQGSARSYPGSYGQTGGGSFSPRQSSHDYRDDHRSSFGGGSSSGNEPRGRWSGREDDDYRSSGDYGGRPGSYGSGMGGQAFSRSQYGRQEFSQDQDRDRGDRYNYGGWGDDDSRRQSSGRSGMGAAAGGAAAYGASRMGGHHDEHYSSWRQRQIDELDRDYDAYRQEHRSKFENEFSGWRQQRQTKRQMLHAIREQDEVVDQNGEHIGTVDKVRGDTIILTRNDPEAGGVHRSFSCSLLERVEGGRVYLAGSKDSLRSQLHEERDDKGRGGGGLLSGLFGGSRDDERREESRQSATPSTQAGSTEHTGEGPHILDRSFSGTYDDDSKKS